MLAILAQFMDPSEGPPPSGGLETSPTPFLVLILVGFLVGGLGHLFRVRMLVGIGIFLIVLATLVLPVSLAISR